MSADARARLRDALTALGWRVSEDKPERLCAEIERPPTQFLQVTITRRLDGEPVADVSIWDWSKQENGEINALDPTVRSAITTIWNALDQPAAGSAERAEREQNHE